MACFVFGETPLVGADAKFITFEYHAVIREDAHQVVSPRPLPGQVDARLAQVA